MHFLIAPDKFWQITGVNLPLNTTLNYNAFRLPPKQVCIHMHAWYCKIHSKINGYFLTYNIGTWLNLDVNDCTEFKFPANYSKKNPAYRRYWNSQPMRRVGQIQFWEGLCFKKTWFSLGKIMIIFFFIPEF